MESLGGCDMPRDVSRGTQPGRPDPEDFRP